MALVQIDQIAFEQLRKSFTGFILLCVPGFNQVEDNSTSALQAIEKLSADLANMQAYLINESHLHFFQNQFKFWGTPIYILLHNRLEIDRLLGKVSEDTIVNFLEEHLFTYPR